MFFRRWLTCSPVLIGLATMACATFPVPSHATETRTATDTQVLAQATARARLAGVPDADVQAVVRLALLHHYSTAVTAGFVQQMGQVSSRHLPVNAVRDKILEGIAKQAPATLITWVADRWTQATAQAALRVNRIQPLLPMSASQRVTLVNMGALEIHQHGHPYLLDQLATQLSAHRTMDAEAVLKAMQISQAFMLYGASVQQESQVLASNLSSTHPQQQRRLDQQALALLRAGKPAAVVMTQLHLAPDQVVTQRDEHQNRIEYKAPPAPHMQEPRRVKVHAKVQTHAAVQVHANRQTSAPVQAAAAAQSPATVQAHGEKKSVATTPQSSAAQSINSVQPALVTRPEQVQRPEQVLRPEHIERPEPIERPERPDIPVPVERPGR